MNMKPQKPAQGIVLLHDWGESKMYKAVCECGNDDCSHTLDIEADHEITVTIYTQSHTTFWSKSRWVQIWQLLTTGRIEVQNSLILSRQSALNYSQVLKEAASYCRLVKDK